MSYMMHDLIAGTEYDVAGYRPRGRGYLGNAKPPPPKGPGAAHHGPSVYTELRQGDPRACYCDMLGWVCLVHQSIYTRAKPLEVSTMEHAEPQPYPDTLISKPEPPACFCSWPGWTCLMHDVPRRNGMQIPVTDEQAMVNYDEKERAKHGRVTEPMAPPPHELRPVVYALKWIFITLILAALIGGAVGVGARIWYWAILGG